VVSTDCVALRCSARHAPAGIAIATVTSLRHRPTTDSGTDIATLVRRALAEVYTAVLLVMAALCNRGAIIFLPCSFYLLSIFFLFFLA